MGWEDLEPAYGLMDVALGKAFRRAGMGFYTMCALM